MADRKLSYTTVASMSSRWLAAREYAGMLVAGGLGAVVSIPLFALLVSRDVHPLAANAVALASALVVTFCVNYFFVFKSRTLRLKSAYLKFLVVALATSLADFAVIALAQASLSPGSLQWTLIKAAAVGAGVVLRLTLYRSWAFKDATS